MLLLPLFLDQDITYKKERPKWVKKMLGFLGIVAQTQTHKNYQLKLQVKIDKLCMFNL